MNTLYLIGGSSRCGKTTLMNELVQQKPMVGISSDAIRAEVRRLQRNKIINFEETAIEEQLPWEMLVGIIERYDHLNIPLVAEGVVITPERVRSLQLENLEMKVAFVGFTADSYIDHIIEHGKQTKDHIYQRIEENDGDESSARELLKDIQSKSIELQTDVAAYGYSFFIVDELPFSEFKTEVLHYLLKA